MSINRFLLSLLLGLSWLPMSSQAAQDAPLEFINAKIAEHAEQSGAYVLDTGSDALLARAWLADHAQQTIEVQYFIWSADNIGILAAEALLRAADCGAKVRVQHADAVVIEEYKQLA